MPTPKSKPSRMKNPTQKSATTRYQRLLRCTAGLLVDEGRKTFVLALIGWAVAR